MVTLTATSGLRVTEHIQTVEPVMRHIAATEAQSVALQRGFLAILLNCTFGFLQEQQANIGRQRQCAGRIGAKLGGFQFAVRQHLTIRVFGNQQVRAMIQGLRRLHQADFQIRRAGEHQAW